MSRLKNIAARRVAANQRLYIPVDGDTAEDLRRKAFNCGLNLASGDERSKWLNRPEHAHLIEVYHNGQAEQFECEEY